MRKFIVTLYSFKELSEKIQQEALEKLWDINVDYNWWDYHYEDAANVQLELTGFDVDGHTSVKGKFKSEAINTAQMILTEHGEESETYKLAEEFRIKYEDMCDPNSTACQGDIDDLESWFLSELLNEYAEMLKTEYEYRTSKEAIIETIESNEFTFEEDGIINNGNKVGYVEFIET